jgi:hypothetical protein
VGRAQVMRRLEGQEVYQYQDGEIEKIEASEDLSLGPVDKPAGADDEQLRI